MFLYLTLYMQEVLGYGPFAAGLRFLPITMLAFIVAPIAGKLTVRVSSRYLLGLGLILIALGCVLTTHVEPNSTWTVLLPGFIVAGIGIGITNPVVASATVSVVPPEHSGMASGASSTFRQVGIATGIAGLGAVFLSQIRPATTSALAATPAGRVVLAHAGSRLSGAVAERGVRQAAASIPDAGRPPCTGQRLPGRLHLHLQPSDGHRRRRLLIGGIGALVLVRQRDFVPSYSAEDPDPAALLDAGAGPAAGAAAGAAPVGPRPTVAPAPEVPSATTPVDGGGGPG